MAIGEPIRCAPTACRARSRRRAGRRPAGAGGSAPRRAPASPRAFRSPPAPYRERKFKLGPGHCCVCGQKVYRFGWHADLWDRGPNRNAEWHACCVVAWRLWNAPSGELRLLKRLQGHRCAQSGKRLLRTSEVDHRTPLFEVWRERRDAPWPELLGFWGLPNLQVINRDVHVAKCATEARSRMRTPKAPASFWPSVRHLMESLEGALELADEAAAIG